MKILLTEKGWLFVHNTFTLSSPLFLLEERKSIVYIKSRKVKDSSICKVEISEEEKWKPRKVKKLITIGARGSILGGLESLCSDLSLTRAIGLASNVQTPNGIMHIPMIDFVEKTNSYWPDMNEYRSSMDKFQVRIIEKLSIPGMVVDSGNSFHFYGFQLLTHEDWQNLMLDIRGQQRVDKFWPDLSLKQGYSMLRITPSRFRLYQPAIYPLFNCGQSKKRNFDSSYEPKEDITPINIQKESLLVS